MNSEAREREASFRDWCTRHDQRTDRTDTKDMFDDAYSLGRQAALSTEAQPEVKGAVVKFPESFVSVQEVIRHMSMWAEGKVMGSSRSPYDDCYPEKGDIRRVKRTAAFLLPRLKAAFEDLVEFGLLYEKRAPSPSAIEAAVNAKLEEVVNMIEHTPSLKDPDDTARLIQNKVRALMESPHTSVEEPAN